MGTCLPAPSPHQNVVSELDGRGGECAPQGFLRARPQTCVSSTLVSLSDGVPEHVVFLSAFCLISRVAYEWWFLFVLF